MASVSVRRRPFTVDEYHRMGEVGILHEDEHVELIEGEVLIMTPIGGRHVGCVIWVSNWFVRQVGDHAWVSTQNPVRLSERSEPEPDIAVLRPRADDYRDHVPDAADVLLLIEVADSSLPYDKATKVPLYAAAGIPDVWLVDLPSDQVLSHRKPEGGVYREVVSHQRGTSLIPLAFPHLSITVDEILGRPRTG